MDLSIWAAAIAPALAAILAAILKPVFGHRGNDASRAFELTDRLTEQLPFAALRVEEARRKQAEAEHAEGAVAAAEQGLTSAQETLKRAKWWKKRGAAATAVEAAEAALKKAEALPSPQLSTETAKSNVAYAEYAQKTLEEQINRMRSAAQLLSNKYATKLLSAGMPMEANIFFTALAVIYLVMFLATPETPREDDDFAFWMRRSYVLISVASGITVLIGYGRENLLRGNLKNLGILYARRWPLKRDGKSKRLSS